MESKLNTIRRCLICSVSSKTRWLLLITQAHSLKTLPARLPSTLELRKQARRSAGLNWLDSPSVRGKSQSAPAKGLNQCLLTGRKSRNLDGSPQWSARSI